VHFFGKGCCENVQERSNEEGEKQKGLIAKLKCQYFMSKEVILKQPCMSMCLGTNGTVIRTSCEKRGGAEGGEGEIRGAKG
jgi:hypothetical protein